MLGPEREAVVGQVSNVSVLFTDLVGSTALASSVSPEVADRLRREHFAVLRRAVAEADGTEVKNLGDGLMVVFPTASAALACAVGMQQATEADNRGREVPFGLRVGVAAGEASVEDGDYFGDPVVEAARLCALSESGQVLATDLVRGMAGRRNPHRCVPLGDLKLKGLPEPVPAVEVTWEPLGAAPPRERVPLPARLSGRPAAGLVGRGTELESLADAFKRVAGGGGREVVVVSGEAGLGKTTLVAEAARAAFDAGACVLFGHAEEDLATPYGMFAEAFGHLVTHAADDDLRAYVADCGSDLARIVPALARRLPDVDAPPSSDGETERYLLYGAAIGLLRHVAAERPVVLVVDDLQWADTASLQLLRHVVGEDPGLGLLVLGTFRDTEVSAGHPLVDALAALWRMERVTRVDLQGLDDRGVVDLLEATAGHELDEPGVELAHALYRETDGNPFFLSEVLRHLVETGALYRDDTTGRWVSDLTLEELRLPDSVREVVGARVARLGPQATRVLSTAAVIGRDFDLELLTRATDTDTDDVLDLLEAAEAAALVREPATVAGRFSFTHALIQRTLYQDLSTNRRARTHERIAEALEDLTAGRPGDRVGELAHHWAQAMRPTEVAKAIDYAAKAGHAALEQLAPAEALRWYGQALELLGEDQRRTTRGMELRVGLGEAQRLSGLPEHSTTLLAVAKDARSAGDPTLLTRALLSNTRGYASSIGQVDPVRIELIRAALDVAARPADRARLLALLATELGWNQDAVDERLACADEAVNLARQVKDPSVFVEVVVVAAEGRYVPETTVQRASDAFEASRIAETLDDPFLLAQAHWNAAFAALDLGDRDGIDRHVTTLDEIAERLGIPLFRAHAASQRGLLAMIDGNPSDVDRWASRYLEIASSAGFDDALLVWAPQMIVAAWQRGRLGDLIPMLHDTVRENPTIPTYRTALTWAYACEGDADSASELLETAREDDFATPLDHTWLSAHAMWADSVYRTQDRDGAEHLLGRVDPWVEFMPNTRSSIGHNLAASRGLIHATCGDFDSAIADLESAVEVHRRLRAPHLTASSEVLLADVLIARADEADAERARQLVAPALTTAKQRGYGYVERDALAVLARLGPPG